MTIWEQGVFVVSSISKLAVTVGLTAMTAIGTLASILGAMTWVTFAWAEPHKYLVSFFALTPLLACLCIRNLQILSENWIEMSWRPLVEVGLITIASLLSLWGVKAIEGWVW